MRTLIPLLFALALMGAAWMPGAPSESTAAPATATATQASVEAEALRTQAQTASREVRELLSGYQSLIVAQEEQAEVVSATLEVLSHWFTSNLGMLGGGVALFLLALMIVHIGTGRLRRKAKALRKRAEKQLEEEDKEPEEPEESAARQERAHRREERDRLAAQHVTSARRLDQTARGIEGLCLIGLLFLLGVYLLWVVVHTDGHRIFGLIADYRAILLRDFSDRIIRVVFIVIGAEIFRRLLMLLAHHTIVRARARTTAVETETQRELRARTLSNVINGTATVVIYVWAFILVLQALGMNIAAVLTGVGIAGLAIGFGAQSLVKDFIGGFYILLENQYRVGDLVDIAGKRGVVEQITMRSTRLRNSLDGIVHVIPNGEIQTVSNLSFLWSRHEAKIGVSYNEDPDEVLEILERVGKQMREEEPWSGLLMDDPKVLGLDEFADSALVFKVVFQTEPLQQFTIGREYKRRLFYAFKEAGIEIPFPHRTVYHRQDEGGKPFSISTEERETQGGDES